jgi:preprotein translocase subunit YajC
MLTLLASVTSAGLALFVQAAQPSAIGLFLPLILIMVIFYFLMILPAQRRQKKVSQMLKSLKTGDKVVTSGGIYGTIVGLDDESVQLRIAEQVKVKVTRSAVAGLQPDQQQKESSKTA